MLVSTPCWEWTPSRCFKQALLERKHWLDTGLKGSCQNCPKHGGTCCKSGRIMCLKEAQDPCALRPGQAVSIYYCSPLWRLSPLFIGMRMPSGIPENLETFWEAPKPP